MTDYRGHFCNDPPSPPLWFGLTPPLTPTQDEMTIAKDELRLPTLKFVKHR